MEFDNKLVLVTGATSGIGKKIAEELISNGATVIINYGHDDNKAKELKDIYKDKIYIIKADISDELEVKDMFDEIKKQYGKLNYLVNNAGTNIDSYIENFDIKDFKKVIDTNLIGKFLCTKYAIPLLRVEDNSSIVNIASKLGTNPCEEASAYCISEAGIINLTKCSMLELSKYKIRVNTVSPSFVKTPLSLAGWTSEEIELKKEKNPLKRLGETIDIANTVLFLLSNKASFINGQNINVNGGSLT